MRKYRRILRRKVLPHLGIVLSGMLAVLLIIDRVNNAMVFIDHDITKGLMAVLCVVSILNGAQLLARPAHRSQQHGGDKAKCNTNRRKTSATSASSRT